MEQVSLPESQGMSWASDTLGSFFCRIGKAPGGTDPHCLGGGGPQREATCQREVDERTQTTQHLEQPARGEKGVGE